MENIVRNMERNGTHHLLKPFIYDEYNQCRIVFMTMLFYESAQLAEQIAIDDLQDPYFWKTSDQGWEKNIVIPEYELMQKMAEKLQKQ